MSSQQSQVFAATYAQKHWCVNANKNLYVRTTDRDTQVHHHEKIGKVETMGFTQKLIQDVTYSKVFKLEITPRDDGESQDVDAPKTIFIFLLEDMFLDFSKEWKDFNFHKNITENYQKKGTSKQSGKAGAWICKYFYKNAPPNPSTPTNTPPTGNLSPKIPGALDFGHLHTPTPSSSSSSSSSSHKPTPLQPASPKAKIPGTPPVKESPILPLNPSSTDPAKRQNKRPAGKSYHYCHFDFCIYNNYDL